MKSIAMLQFSPVPAYFCCGWVKSNLLHGHLSLPGHLSPEQTASGCLSGPHPNQQLKEGRVLQG